MNIWDDPARVSELIAHIEDGLSGNKTADAMGLTPGQVQGKAERMGLKFKSVPGHKRRKAGGATRTSFKSTVEIEQEFPYREAPEIAPEVIVEPLMLMFGQLNDSPIISQCRFPFGDDPKTMVYCGLPVAKEECSWCSTHRKLTYQQHH